MDHHLKPVPANPHDFVLYLQHLGENSQSKSAAEEVCNAISWVHANSGLVSPASHPLVKAALSGVQRILAKPVVNKEPMTVDMIKAVVLDAERTGSLSDMRLATACVLGYAGFLRFSELVELKPANFAINKSMMTIRITHSKTDQLRQGDEVVIARADSRMCPVSMLERYLLTVGMTLGDEQPLFRAIQKTKNGEKLWESGGHKSYSCLRSLYVKKMSDLRFPAHEFGLHSLKAGDATAAANASVPDRIFKRHRRWKSENAKDGYVKDSLESRLMVSRNLQLATLSLWPNVASSQPLWRHNTNGGKGVLCMHVLRVCLVCEKGMVWEMYFLAFERSELDKK